MQGIFMLLHFFVFFAVRNSLNFNFGIIHGIYDFVLWNLEQVVKYEVPRSWLHSFSNTWKFQFGIHGIF